MSSITKVPDRLDQAVSARSGRRTPPSSRSASWWCCAGRADRRGNLRGHAQGRRLRRHGPGDRVEVAVTSSSARRR